MHPQLWAEDAPSRILFLKYVVTESDQSMIYKDQGSECVEYALKWKTGKPKSVVRAKSRSVENGINAGLEKKNPSPESFLRY